jgi:hypothetical protein
MSQKHRNESDDQVKNSGVVYIIRIHAQLLILAVAYFIAAVTYFAGSLILIKHSPRLINERAKKRGNTKSWDKALLSLYLLIGFPGTHIVAGLDKRFEWSGLDMIYMIHGAALYIIAASVQITSMLANKTL